MNIREVIRMSKSYLYYYLHYNTGYSSQNNAKYHLPLKNVDALDEHNTQKFYWDEQENLIKKKSRLQSKVSHMSAPPSDLKLYRTKKRCANETHWYRIFATFYTTLIFFVFVVCKYTVIADAVS